MRMSDAIARFIQEVLENENGTCELQRADLAHRFGCVPSQINYVIHTRFSPEHGYLVESRRGGGGYIRIRRVRYDCERLLMHAVNAVGDTLDLPTARAFVSNLAGADVIDDKTARLMAAAMGEPALRSLPPDARDTVRAAVFKQMVLNGAKE